MIGLGWQLLQNYWAIGRAKRGHLLIFFLDFNGNLNTFGTFSKNTETDFHENSSGGSLVLSCGRTDRHDESKSLFSRFFELT